jgi:4,5-DOPA dioxygenase extradiol
MPALFLAHGSPMLLDDATWKSELRAWGKSLGKPKALLFVSAHWTRSPVRLGATRPAPLVYDFSGFPERYYEVQYPAPTAETVASRVRELLAAQGQKTDDTERGLDHGVWVPLMAMYPEADVPVLQISMPSLAPESLFALGERLAPLRDEGVVIVGSGFLTHNLRTLDPSPGAHVPSWASELDAFCKEALVRRDVDALLDYRSRAPGVAEALPTHEHFVPLFVALGAAQNEAATFPIEGFTYGSFTKRSVELGSRV